MTQLEQLRHAIGILAAQPEDQQIYLAEIGLGNDASPDNNLSNIDELGLQFEDATYLTGKLLRSGELTTKAVANIEKLNDFLLGWSGTENSDFWTIQALYKDNRWAKVRALARECLSEMNWEAPPSTN